jgi:putative restriction endonuclease
MVEPTAPRRCRTQRRHRGTKAMNSARAWSLIVVGAGEERQHAGNRGYEDNPRSVYRYDSKVANHRDVATGDLALVRNRDRLLGIAQIERIGAEQGKKTINRCPQCGTSKIRTRENRLPRYRCWEGHEFAAPTHETVDVTLYEAHSGGSFVDAPDAVAVNRIRRAAPRPSSQLSIEEVNVRTLEQDLLSAFPRTRSVLASFFQAGAIGREDAAEEAASAARHEAPFVGSISDTREAVLRSIRQRRGQKKFRDSLFRRYGARCMMTGCALTDVLEAAHIWPYRGEADNHPENGLLLRTDLHTLFDLDLIAVNPETLAIEVAPALMQIETYAVLQGTRLGAAPGVRPALEPLRSRWTVFKKLRAPARMAAVEAAPASLAPS